MKRSSKKHLCVEKICIENPHIKSRASYVKLKRYLKKRDTDNYRLNYGFRMKFLRLKIKEHGKLICEYCERDDLILDPLYPDIVIRKTRLATLDHVRCKEKGGSLFDSDNIKVACPKCNHDKANFTLKEFEEILEKTGVTL